MPALKPEGPLCGRGGASGKEGGKSYMGWRTKFVSLLIVYAAGFATAIYCLAPTPEQTSQPLQLAQLGSALNSEKLVKSFNSGMHKCIGFSKEAALETAKLIRTKMEEMAKSPPPSRQ
jgi:hypothetical protein